MVFVKKIKYLLEEFSYSFIINQRFVDIILIGISSENYLKNLDFKKIFDKRLLGKCLQRNEKKKMKQSKTSFKIGNKSYSFKYSGKTFMEITKVLLDRQDNLLEKTPFNKKVMASLI